MHKRKIDVSLWEIQELIELLSKKIIESHKIDSIVAISRGGIIPARYLAKPLVVRRIYTVGIEFYEDAEKKKQPKIYQRLTEQLTDQTILIIDDIVDSGESMKLAVEEVKLLSPKEIFTCTLYYKQNSIYKPNFYGKSVCDEVWFKYPWE